MKKLSKLALALSLAFTMLVLVACGEPPATSINLGTYNATNNTFTNIASNAGYSLEENGTTLTLKGTIPYSPAITGLGVSAGNIVAIKFKLETALTPDAETKIQTTNNSVESKWNTYDKTALEADGSLIWVTSVSKTKDVQIKIKWNKDTAEVTYTLKVANDATLSPAT